MEDNFKYDEEVDEEQELYVRKEACVTKKKLQKQNNFLRKL